MCVCVCVALLNQHCNTRFTAPACQDSLWPQGFHHLPVHPVERKTEKKSALEEGQRLKKGTCWKKGLKMEGGMQSEKRFLLCTHGFCWSLTDCNNKKLREIIKTENKNFIYEVINNGQLLL